MTEKKQRAAFEYTYSAKDQEELRRIRSKYLPPEEDKLETLRRLDHQVTQKAATVSILVGTLGTLVLGLGMSCCLVWAGDWFFPGIIIGLSGIVTVALAYPLYDRILRRERARIAPEILRLTDELMKTN